MTDYITSAALKSTLDITDTYADADIATAITAASRVVDEALNRRFSKSTGVTRYYSADPCDNRLQIDDWAAVTTVALDGSANNTFGTTLVADTDYDLTPLNAVQDAEPFTVLELRNRRFPSCTKNVKIIGDFGWPSVPAGVITYTGILAAQFLLRTRQAPFGVLMAGIEVGTSARLARVDPDFQRLVGYLDKSQLLG